MGCQTYHDAQLCPERRPTRTMQSLISPESAKYEASVACEQLPHPIVVMTARSGLLAPILLPRRQRMYTSTSSTEPVEAVACTYKLGFTTMSGECMCGAFAACTRSRLIMQSMIPHWRDPHQHGLRTACNRLALSRAKRSTPRGDSAKMTCRPWRQEQVTDDSLRNTSALRR